MVLLLTCLMLVAGLLPGPAAGSSATVSLWPSSAKPKVVAADDSAAVELGVKFHADKPGTVTGIRFYKASANVGPHVGRLWSESGTLLASVRFTSVSDSGWQQATFSNPVRIEPNRTYVASYWTQSGRYSVDLGYFQQNGVSRAPLHAKTNWAAAGNGVYAYGNGGFPTKSWYGSNYWVDVAFAPDGAPTTTTTAPPATTTTTAPPATTTTTAPRPTTTTTVAPSAAPSIHSSSPAQATGRGTRTTAGFVPPANSTLVAMVAYDTGADGANVNQTVSSSPALEWKRLGRKSPHSASVGGPGTDGGVEIWTARVGASQRYTVSNSQTHNHEGSLKVFVVTGAEASAAGAIAASAAHSGAPTVGLTTTKDNSLILAVSSDWTQGGPAVAGPGQVVTDEYDSPGMVTTHVWRHQAPVARAGTQVVANLVRPATQRHNTLAVEIRSASGATAPPPPTTTTTVAPTTTTTVAPTTTTRPPTPTTTVPPGNGGGELNLPRVPWEGGPAYYAQFPQASANGWTNPNFFPIGVWYESVLSQRDIDLDKGAGLNTYVELTHDSNANLIRQNGMYAIPSSAIPGHGQESVGWMLDDEVDMRYGPGSGYDVMQRHVNNTPRDGRFRYSNYGKGVMMWETDQEAQKFVNDYTQVVSADMYYYTDPYLCWEMENFHGVPQSQCRRSANYGFTMERMRYLDGLDGKRQPIWAFIENGHPWSDNDPPSGTITGPQLTGAVMSSIIHEARGVIYFNHNFGGPCISYHVLRESCGTAVRPYVTEVNRQITQLAPVLNTQSYQHTFNPALNTMLKAHDGSYYVFAMQKRDRTSGSYTFTLPSGMNATSVEVMFENRTLPVSGGKFQDSFAAEYSYHIYKIR